MNTVLETAIKPVIQGVQKINDGNQYEIVTLTIDALMNSWTNYILREDLKFRLDGMFQLNCIIFITFQMFVREYFKC